MSCFEYHHRAFSVISLATMVAIILTWPALTRAALVNPSAPPPGGITAKPLTTGPADQTKFGSLVIGLQGATCDLNEPSNQNGCAKLCLNGNGTEVCIKSWKDLEPSVSGMYLKLITAGFSNADVQAATLPPSLSPNLGYVSIKGLANQVRPYTVNLGPGATVGGSALYADAMLSDNYAGYFVGRVDIKTASLNRGICLNSIETYGSDASADAKGWYCINNWSDIRSAPITDKLTLVTTSASESGNIFLGQSFGAGSVIIGDPINLTVAQKCGDGICSTDGLYPEDATNCSVDCKGVDKPTALAASLTAGSTPTNIKMSLSITAGGAPSIITRVKIMIVRSTSPTGNFHPVNGQTYSRGSVGGDYIAFYEGAASQGYPVLNLLAPYIDNVTGGTPDTTYYYRAYQGNAYPIWSAATDAVAVPLVSLTIDIIAPSALLTVRSADNQINCSCLGTDCLPCHDAHGRCTVGQEQNYCTGVYQADKLQYAELTRTAAFGPYKFCNWTSCPTDSLTCTIDMSSNQTIDVQYAGRCLDTKDTMDESN